MAVILSRLHDESADFARTRRLIDRTVDLVVRVTKRAENPLLKPLRTGTLRLPEKLRAPG